MSAGPSGPKNGGPAPTAGWYPDPWQPGHHRFWDGAGWTTDTFPEALSAAVPQGRWAFAPGPTGPGGAVAGSGPGGSWSATTPTAVNPPEAHPPLAPPPPPGWVPPAWTPPPPPEPLPVDQPPPEPAPSRWPQALVALLVVVALIAGFAGEVEVRRHIHQSKIAAETPTTAPATTTPPTSAPATSGPATTAPATSPTTVAPVLPAPGATPSTTPGSSSGSGQTSDPAHSLLDSMVLKQADVAPSASVIIVPSGQGLGAPTLDLCNGTFPSEALRSDRLQVAGADGQGGGVLQTEAVLYKDPASAAQAVSELAKAKNDCPATPVPDPSGQPVTTKFNPAPDTGWPATAGVDRVAYDFTEDDGSGNLLHFVEVFFRRGRALLGVYYSPDDPPLAVTGQSSPQGIVGVFAQRMAQLPAAPIGA